MKKHIGSVLLAIILSLLSVRTFSQLNPCTIFSSGMVLQREVELPVWGTASVGTTITVTLNGETGNGTADDDGNWEVTLPAMSAGGPYEMSITDGTDTENYSAVYIGDVWLCSGQSNMEMNVSTAANAAETIAKANSQTIRQCKVSKGISDEPSDELPPSSWTPATSSYVGNFTAAGYYFARDIQSHIGDVPIGLLNISYGGSRIEAWMSEEILGYDEKDVTLAAGEDERQPTLLFNKMLNPVIGYPVKGFLWYQGESNGDNMEDARAYGDLFKTMINFWRDSWGMGDLPFIWVQLPNYFEETSEDLPGNWDAWPRLRAGQSRALSLPNTGEAVTIDVGDVDIHPLDKESVGERLALVTRHVAYGEDIVYNGPRYSSHRILDDGSVKIAFNQIGSGLIAKGVADGTLKWFSCAGADEILHRADAVIDGDSVIVTCEAVSEMEIIRYAWEYNPVDVNYYNADSLPAAPFYIYVQPQPFEIINFTIDETLIERGQFIYLEWETSGGSYTAVNGIEKDFIGTTYLMPLDTVVYELVTLNASDDTDTLRSSITVNVIDPLPVITVYTDYGNAYPPNEEITLKADAYAPAGGTIVAVDFYINDELYFTDTEEPYETTWTPQELGTYVIKGIATNDAGATKEATYTIYINDLERVRFEAEDADLDGDYSIQSNGSTSEGKYVDLTATWTITFNIEVPETGNYQSVIRYLLNYESPKEQYLSINGAEQVAVRFEADDITTWMDYGISLPLVEGKNTVSISTYWGWMSFDYIDVLGAINPTTSVSEKSFSESREIDLSYFYQSNTIEYTIPENGNVILEVYNSMGKKIKTFENRDYTAGTYSTEFSTHSINKGIYFIILAHNNEIVTKKIVVR